MNDSMWLVWIVGIICYTIYKVLALRSQSSNRYEELRTLSELRDKGVITQAEFDAKKSIILK